MMQELDEIIYAALTANTALMTEVGGHIKSTCFEVPPTSEDNVPLPYIIVTDDPWQNEQESKDDEWESDSDIVQASVIINAKSPKDVKRLRRQIRHIIAEYVEDMEYEARPELRSLSNDGISWDWTKPCYFDTLHYQCEMYLNIEDNEQD
jgi:hypothetical protein